jgi:cytochrome c-type biogenesis protein CcmH
MQLFLFWAVAALIAGGAALLMLARASAAERSAAPVDPELEVYRRQLGEIDELAERGLLGPDEQRAAHAEAGRRLLGQAGRRQDEARAPAGAGRRWVLAAAIAAPLLALGGYMVLGSPGFPDQPYKSRLAGWLAASRSSPMSLTVPQMRAVLEVYAAQRPNDPEAVKYLADVEAAEGDYATAVKHFQRATALNPNDAEAWARLGTAMANMNNGVDDDAVAAFRRAHQLAPDDPKLAYMLGYALIADRMAPQGLAEWRALAGRLDPADKQRAVVEAQIAEVERTGRPPADAAEAAPGAAQAGTQQQAAFIQSMVEGLAARLKAKPEDPEGWARLIRAYGVLGQTQKRQAAIDAARQQFKDRPDALKTALAGEAAPPIR